MKQQLIERLLKELQASKASIEQMKLKLVTLFKGDAIGYSAGMFGFTSGLVTRSASVYGQEFDLTPEDIASAISSAITEYARQDVMASINKIFKNSLDKRQEEEDNF